MSKIIIVGAGENGRVVANILRLNPKNKIVGFLDDKPDLHKKCLGKIRDAAKYLKKDYSFFVSVCDNDSRRKIFTELKIKGASFINAVHPTAVIEKSAVLGKNIMIGAGSYININSRLGDGVIINNGCIVEHDNQIGSFVHLAPGVVTGGGVKIGSNTFVGLATVINDHLKLGADSVIGSGAVVINDLPDKIVAIGCPARVIKKR